MLHNLLRCCLLLVLASPAAAQDAASLRLRIADLESGSPLPDVRISVIVNGEERATLSNADGVAGLTVPPGEWPVIVSRLGYATERILVEFSPGAAVEGEIDLMPAAILLEGVEVVARPESLQPRLERAGFFDRRRSGFGAFRTREDIEERRHREITDVLWGIPGVRVVTTPSGGKIAASRRTDGLGADLCYLPIYLDGVLFRMDDLNEIPLDWIAGVEVYRSAADLPPQFNPRGRGCGAVVLWTR